MEFIKIKNFSLYITCKRDLSTIEINLSKVTLETVMIQIRAHVVDHHPPTTPRKFPHALTRVVRRKSNSLNLLPMSCLSRSHPSRPREIPRILNVPLAILTCGKFRMNLIP